jgi:RND family efflux transporter MFP subunit
MNWYNNTHPWLGRKAVRGAILLALLVVILGGILLLGSTAEQVVVDELPPVVRVTSSESYIGNTTINLIGTVRAFSEAAVTAEQSGRVTGVRVGLGDTVTAGQIIVTLENASQQAGVLQAQGSYEAALAAAAQSFIGTNEATNQLESARNNAVSVFRTAYNTVNQTMLAEIDTFFANPNSSLPGLRIDGRGQTQLLNAERISYQTVLPQWQAKTTVITTQSDLPSELQYASANVLKTIGLVDMFLIIFTDQNNSSRYTESELQVFITEFSTLRATLLNTKELIESAQTNLVASVEGVKRAELAAAGGVNSAADAQVKQALGSLRAAQANLAKTIIRSPISGTVNNLAVRTGDFIGAQSQIAEVANNNALEIVTYAGEGDRTLLMVGATVVVEDEFSGIITEIAPAVDTNTGKTEVRIASESASLQNGDLVKITQEVEVAASTQVVIPLSAVKFQITDGSIFVVADEILTTRPVTLGTIRGGSVVITDGLSGDEEFVADARGLVEGTKVQTIQ